MRRMLVMYASVDALIDDLRDNIDLRNVTPRSFLPDPSSGAIVAYHPKIETMRRTDKDACEACKGRDEECWHCGGTGIDPSK